MEVALENRNIVTDERQRIVDFVGHAGGQVANSGKPFGADELLATLVDLPRKLAVSRMQTGGHVVEGGGQFLQFIL